jgi:hypothetical protein
MSSVAPLTPHAFGASTQVRSENTEQAEVIATAQTGLALLGEAENR